MAPKPFSRHYKDINFETLKERHDNFSFHKAIETQHIVHDTLHFQNLGQNAMVPDMVVFGARKTADRALISKSVLTNTYTGGIETPGTSHTRVMQNSYRINREQ